VIKSGFTRLDIDISLKLFLFKRTELYQTAFVQAQEVLIFICMNTSVFLVITMTDSEMSSINLGL